MEASVIWGRRKKWREERDKNGNYRNKEEGAKKKKPFSFRYLRQSSRVSCEMSSSVNWLRGLSSIDRNVAAPALIAADSEKTDEPGGTPP